MQPASSQFKTPLGIVTSSYLLVWVMMLLERASSQSFSNAIYGFVFALSIPLGIIWIYKSFRPQQQTAIFLSAVFSLLYAVWWSGLLFVADANYWNLFRAHLARWGTGALFFIGLCWVVWFVERKSATYYAIRQGKLPEKASDLLKRKKLADIDFVETIWNPLDTDAWYYGEKGKRLNQSVTTLVSYSLAFLLAMLILTNLRGCREIYELPGGGGEQVTIAKKIKIKKVIHKKFVVNPYSAIKMNERKIDDVVIEVEEQTEHLHKAGEGEGIGAGFEGGTPNGMVRFIRLEYSGGDWEQDFGVGGDLNMLMEYGIRTTHKVGKKTESRQVSQLRNFPVGKSPPMVYMTGQRNISLSNSEKKILTEYLTTKHGMIFCDNGGSRHFHNQFLAMMSQVLPEIRPVAVPLDDTIHKIPNVIPFLPYVAPHGGKDALGWKKDGRWLCYYHPGDIGDAWADGHAGVKPEITEACYQLGTNVIFYANAEYSRWVKSRNKGKAGKK